MIFLFSSQPGEESSKISNDLIIRKLGHFSEYMTLGFFSCSYLSNLFIENSKIKDFKKTGILSFLFSVIYALSDEFHQTLHILSQNIYQQKYKILWYNYRKRIQIMEVYDATYSC